MDLFDLLKWFAKPVVRISLALVTPLSIVLGAIADPEGAVNAFLCRLIDVVASVWPSTPDQFKLSNLIFSQANVTVGQALLSDLLQTLAAMGAIVFIVKVYKLIPFKAT